MAATSSVEELSAMTSEALHGFVSKLRVARTMLGENAVSGRSESEQLVLYVRIFYSYSREWREMRDVLIEQEEEQWSEELNDEFLAVCFNFLVDTLTEGGALRCVRGGSDDKVWELQRDGIANLRDLIKVHLALVEDLFDLKERHHYLGARRPKNNEVFRFVCAVLLEVDWRAMQVYWWPAFLNLLVDGQHIEVLSKDSERAWRVSVEPSRRMRLTPTQLYDMIRAGDILQLPTSVAVYSSHQQQQQKRGYYDGPAQDPDEEFYAEMDVQDSVGRARAPTQARGITALEFVPDSHAELHVDMSFRDVASRAFTGVGRDNDPMVLEARSKTDFNYLNRVFYNAGFHIHRASSEYPELLGTLSTALARVVTAFHGIFPGEAEEEAPAHQCGLLVLAIHVAQHAHALAATVVDPDGRREAAIGNLLEVFSSLSRGFTSHDQTFEDMLLYRVCSGADMLERSRVVADVLGVQTAARRLHYLSRLVVEEAASRALENVDALGPDYVFSSQEAHRRTFITQQQEAGRPAILPSDYDMELQLTEQQRRHIEPVAEALRSAFGMYAEVADNLVQASREQRLSMVSLDRFLLALMPEQLAFYLAAPQLARFLVASAMIRTFHLVMIYGDLEVNSLAVLLEAISLVARAAASPLDGAVVDFPQQQKDHIARILESAASVKNISLYRLVYNRVCIREVSLCRVALDAVRRGGGALLDQCRKHILKNYAAMMSRKLSGVGGGLDRWLKPSAERLEELAVEDANTSSTESYLSRYSHLNWSAAPNVSAYDHERAGVDLGSVLPLIAAQFGLEHSELARSDEIDVAARIKSLSPSLSTIERLSAEGLSAAELTRNVVLFGLPSPEQRALLADVSNQVFSQRWVYKEKHSNLNWSSPSSTEAAYTPASLHLLPVFRSGEYSFSGRTSSTLKYLELPPSSVCAVFVVFRYFVTAGVQLLQGGEGSIVSGSSLERERIRTSTVRLGGKCRFTVLHVEMLPYTRSQWYTGSLEYASRTAEPLWDLMPEYRARKTAVPPIVQLFSILVEPPL